MVPVDLRIKNPMSGVELAVYESYPQGPGPFPAIVVMPAGIMPGALQSQHDLGEYTSRGIAVIRFDPDGRGNSGGVEDRGGPNHQAGLRAVLMHTLENPRVDRDRVGVVSFSFGVTAATVMLAENNPGAKFLIDWEGPASRNWTECNKPSEDMQPCSDDAYWNVREASTQVGKLHIPYLRVQSSWDHHWGDNRGSGIEMVTAAEKGGLAYVRMNDNAPNTAATALASVTLPNFQDHRLLAEAIATWCFDLWTVSKGGTPPSHDFGMGVAAPGAGPGPRRQGMPGPRGVRP